MLQIPGQTSSNSGYSSARKWGDKKMLCALLMLAEREGRKKMGLKTCAF
jgi:hypothetical protein